MRTWTEFGGNQEINYSAFTVSLLLSYVQSPSILCYPCTNSGVKTTLKGATFVVESRTYAQIFLAKWSPTDKKKKKKKKKMLTSFTPYAGGGGLIKTFYLIHCCVIELMHPKFSGIPLILPVNKQWFFKKVWSVFSMRQYSSLLEFRVYLGRDLAYQFHYSKVCSPWHLFCSPDHQCKFATQMANLRPEWYSSYSLLCD